MHDPTEGGLSAALRELGQASGLGVVLFEQPLPVAEVTRTLCAFFGIEILGLISSGSLLVTCEPSQSPRLLEAFDRASLPATRIGQMQPADAGFRIGTRPLPAFERDELARVM